MKIIKKIVPIIFIVIFAIVLSILFFFDGMDYHLKRNFLIPNIAILVFLIIPLFSIYYFLLNRKDEIEDKKYKKSLILISTIMFLIEILLAYFMFFYTDWDVLAINEASNLFLKTNTLKSNYYLTLCPNNIFITLIYVILKNTPLLGKNYMFIIIFNCVLVSLSGVFTSLTVRNIFGNRKAIFSYVIIIPAILLNPWFVIPYSDTFTILIPILILYFYTKKNKKWYYFTIISLLSAFGYLIKPTTIIILLAILIVEIFNIKKYKIKDILIASSSIVLAVLLSYSVNLYAYEILDFSKSIYAKPTNIYHFLAQGQNDYTSGAYSKQDVNETISHDDNYNIEKFKARLLNRNFGETVTFFTKKTLLNFNDGSFTWGNEGVFFYKKIERNNIISNYLANIYYKDGKYYDLFIQLCNCIWLLILFFCPYIVFCNKNKYNLVIMLSIIGITIFATIFEARTRYFYTYLPIFIVCAISGITQLKEKLKTLKK